MPQHLKWHPEIEGSKLRMNFSLWAVTVGVKGTFHVDYCPDGSEQWIARYSHGNLPRLRGTIAECIAECEKKYDELLQGEGKGR